MNILIVGHKHLNPISANLVNEWKKNKTKVFFWPNGASDEVINNYTKAGANVIKHPNTIASEKVLVLATKLPSLSPFKNFHKESIIIFNPLYVNNVKLLNQVIKYGLTTYDYEFFNKDGNYYFLDGIDRIKANFFIKKIKDIIEKQKPIKIDRKKSKISPKEFTARRKILVVEASSVNQEMIINLLISGNEIVLLEQNQDLYNELLKDSFFKDLAKKHHGTFKVDRNTYDNLNKYCKSSDIIIAGNLIPGHLASKSITKEMIASMPPLSVAIDTSIENGTCFENLSTPIKEKSMPKIRNHVYHYASELYYLDSLSQINEIIGNGFKAIIKTISLNNSKYNDGLMTKNGIVINQYLQEALNIKAK